MAAVGDGAREREQRGKVKPSLIDIEKRSEKQRVGDEDEKKDLSRGSYS